MNVPQQLARKCADKLYKDEPRLPESIAGCIVGVIPLNEYHALAVTVKAYLADVSEDIRVTVALLDNMETAQKQLQEALKQRGIDSL